MNGKEGFLIQTVNGAPLEHLFQEHIAQGGGQLVDQPGNTQILVTDNGLLRVKHLAHFQRNLGLLKGMGQVLNAGNPGANTHNGVAVELGGKGVANGASQLFQILAVHIGAHFLHQGNVLLVNVNNQILGLVREKVLNHIIDGHIRILRHSNEKDHSRSVIIEMQLAGFDINIAGQDIVQDHVLYKIGTIEFLVVILLDLVQRHGDNVRIMLAHIVRTVHKYRIIRVHGVAKGLICAVIHTDLCPAEHAGRDNALACLADLAQLTASDHGTALVHHTDGTVQHLTHLVYNALKQSVGHQDPTPLSILYQIKGIKLHKFNHPLLVILYNAFNQIATFRQKFLLFFVRLA